MLLQRRRIRLQYRTGPRTLLSRSRTGPRTWLSNKRAESVVNQFTNSATLLGGFRLRDAVPRKGCEMELRWQLITNRKSHMGFQLQQTSIHCSVVRVMHIVIKRLRLESRGCHYKVAHIPQPPVYYVWRRNSKGFPQPPVYYVWRRNSKWFLSNFKHNFGLTCRLSCVTRVYCDKIAANRITQFSLQSS